MARTDENPPRFPSPLWASIRSWARDLHQRHPALLPCGLIVLVAIAANLPYLLHVFDPDPVKQVSGLGHISRPGILPGLDSIDPNNGFNAQALGHRAALDWWHGMVPWWNHYEGVGSPLAGEMQSAALLPLTLLMGWSNGQLFFHLALEVVSGLATFFLARRLSVNLWAAFVAGAAFGLNGTFAWFGHAAANPVAFLPVLLLGIETARSAAVDEQRSGWAMIAMGLALSLYAGFPETAYIDGVLAVLWVLVRAATLGRMAAARFIGKVGIGGVVGVLLAAPILVAFRDYLAEGYTGTHNGAIGHAFLVPGALPMTALPYIYGPIFGFNTVDRAGTLAVAWGNVGGYITAALLLLALVGLAGGRHLTLRLLLGGWTVVAVAKSFGQPLAMTAVNALPQMVNTAFFRYSPVSWELAIVVLAALGMHALITGAASRLRIALCTAIALTIILYLASASLPLLHHLVGAPHLRLWAVASVGWAVAAVVACAIAALLFRGPARTALLSAIVVADLMVMFVIPEFSAPRAASLDTRPVAFLKAHLGSGRLYTLGPLAPNYGSYFGLASVNQNDLPLPKRWTDYLIKNLDANADPTSFNGMTRRDPAGPGPAAEFVRNLANFQAIGVKYLLLPPDAETPLLPSGTGMRTVFADQRVRIVEIPDPKPYAEDPAGRCVVTTISLDKFRATCPAPSTMVRRELSMSGWHASVNGAPVPVRPGPPIFQSIALPAGDSKIEFGFVPPHMTAALLGLLLGLAALAAPVAVARIGRRETKPAVQPPEDEDRL